MMNLPHPILKLNEAFLGYGKQIVLGPVNLTVQRGEHILITGPNGGGKSTFLKTVLELIPLCGGSLQYFDCGGKPTDSLSTGYLPQINTQDRSFPISLSEVIDSGLTKGNRKERKARVEELLDLIEMRALADRAIGKLSGGQLQRALLARALAASPELLVLDEPMSYLDQESRVLFQQLLHKLAPEGTTILLVTHDYPQETNLFNWRNIAIGE